MGITKIINTRFFGLLSALFLILYTFSFLLFWINIYPFTGLALSIAMIIVLVSIPITIIHLFKVRKIKQIYGKLESIDIILTYISVVVLAISLIYPLIFFILFIWAISSLP